MSEEEFMQKHAQSVYKCCNGCFNLIEKSFGDEERLTGIRLVFAVVATIFTTYLHKNVEPENWEKSLDMFKEQALYHLKHIKAMEE